MLDWDNKDIEQQKVLLNRWIDRIEAYKKKGTNDIYVDITYIWDKN